MKTIPQKIINKFHTNLMESKLKDGQSLLEHLGSSQGFTQETVTHFQLGYDSVAKRLMIPIIEDGICHNIVGYQKGATPKYLSFRDSNGNTYGSRRLWGESEIKDHQQILICAGLKDRMVAVQNGFCAVCCTTGESSWNSEWNILFTGKDVVVVYDNDETGRIGSKKVVTSLISLTKSIKILDLSEVCSNEKEDLQDYFVKYKRTRQDLLDLISHTSQENSERNNPDLRKGGFLECPNFQKSHISKYSELFSAVSTHFPTLSTVVEICLSVALQLKISDIDNPFALVLIGPPSGSKTTVINMFKHFKDGTFYLDAFTPASFVSHSANSRRGDLEQNVDLLPKIKDKLFLTPEMGVLFSQDGERLVDTFGKLTRLLDGEGLETSSGVHGVRGYSGRNVFMWLGASTPIRYNVWKVLGNLGPRLFFYSMPELIDSDDLDSVNLMLHGVHRYRDNVELCKKLVSDFLSLYWDNGPLTWNHEKNDDEACRQITIYTTLLVRLRGVIDSKALDDEEGADPLVEMPGRAGTLLTNLARGHALLEGRSFITMSDVPVVKEVALNSCPDNRKKILAALISKGGVINTGDIQDVLGVSDKSATKYMRQFHKLKLGVFKVGTNYMPSTLELYPIFRDHLLSDLNNGGL